MQTKVSIDVEGARKSLKSEQLSVSANRSHLEMEIKAENDGRISIQLDRDSVFEIVRASFRGGMLDVAASRLLRSMVQGREDEPDLGR